MDNAHNFRKLKGMLKTTGKIRTVCMQGDNCKRRLKNGDHNHEDKESRDLRKERKGKKENYLFGINYQKRLPTTTIIFRACKANQKYLYPAFKYLSKVQEDFCTVLKAYFSKRNGNSHIACLTPAAAVHTTCCSPVYQ